MLDDIDLLRLRLVVGLLIVRLRLLIVRLALLVWLPVGRLAWIWLLPVRLLRRIRRLTLVGRLNLPLVWIALAVRIP